MEIPAKRDGKMRFDREPGDDTGRHSLTFVSPSGHNSRSDIC
jgi:hypothetical protein